MISGHVEHLRTYQPTLREPFLDIVHKLRRLRPHKQPGQYPIDGWEFVYDVSRGQTQQIARTPIISHHNHAIVKVCLNGRAQVDVWHDLALLRVDHEYWQDEDEIGWACSRKTHPTRVPLRRGIFVIVYPTEAYRVGGGTSCHNLTMATVRVPRELFGPPCRPLRQRHLTNTPILCEL